MSYKIEVSRLEPLKPDERYPASTKVYEQTVESLDMIALIAAVNGMSKPGSAEVKTVP
jgi:hypothetical protein